MKLLLIRHGETRWNQEARCQGISDIPLADRGRAQARLLRDHLGKEEFDSIFASDLSRARETAQIVSGVPAERILIEAGLREMHHGELEGLAWAELLKKHGPLIQKWLSDPTDLRMPGGESIRECGERVARSLEEIRRKAFGQKVLVVSHNLAISSALAVLTGTELGKFRRFQQEPCALTRLEWGGERPEILCCNDYSYVPPEFQTLRYGPHAK